MRLELTTYRVYRACARRVRSRVTHVANAPTWRSPPLLVLLGAVGCDVVGVWLGELGSHVGALLGAWLDAGCLVAACGTASSCWRVGLR